MVPGGPLSMVGHNSGNSTPMFITGKKIKKKYADDLRMWIEMRELYSIHDKLKLELENAR